MNGSFLALSVVLALPACRGASPHPDAEPARDATGPELPVYARSVPRGCLLYFRSGEVVFAPRQCQTGSIRWDGR